MGDVVIDGKSYLLATTDYKMQSLGIMFEIVAKKGKDGGPESIALFYGKESAEKIFTFLEPYLIPNKTHLRGKHFVIRNIHDNTAWHNNLGWTEGEDFDVFNEMEMKNLNLPLDGRWEELPT